MPKSPKKAALPNVSLLKLEHYSLQHGQGSDNPYLQELPEPFTKISWTPTIQIAKDLAQEIGIEDEDEIEIEVSIRTGRK